MDLLGQKDAALGENPGHFPGVEGRMTIQKEGRLAVGERHGVMVGEANLDHTHPQR